MDIEKEIRESWFKNHVADYKKINNKISILDWGAPETIVYRVRYVFDDNMLYISGDLGEAVFRLTWRGNPESFKDINLGYFHSKLSAFDGMKKSWNSEKAKERLQQEINDLQNNYQDYGYENKNDEELIDRISLLETMQDVADDCNTSKEWEARVGFEGYEPLFDQLQQYDVDCWEWIFTIGQDYPARVRAYLIGLKMAAKQLKEMMNRWVGK